MRKFDDELVSGNIVWSVWKLAWPVTLLNLVNGLHGMVDHILVGHYIASESNAANAAIGVAWQVFLVIVVFIASLFHGMNVLISRYAGRQDRENMSRVAYEAFLASVYILVFIVAPAGYFLAPHLLDLVEAPPEVQVHALPYLRVLFVCGAPLFLSFMFTGAFQATGDAKTPLVLGVLATFLNVGISAVLITGAGPFPALGAVGAALGTVLAPLFTVSISIALVLRRKMLILPPEKYRLMPDFATMKVVARIGIPTGIQGVLLNIGGTLVMRFLGAMEPGIAAPALAAYTICYAQLFSLITWTSFGLRAAAGTLMGQNIGAGKHERGKSAVRVAATFGGAWAVLIGAIFWYFPAELLAIFGASQGPIVAIGVSLLQYLTFSGVVIAVALALTGGLQGAGETKLPMYIAFLTQIVVLLGICWWYQWHQALTPERVWMAILISHASRLILTWLVFRTEKWAHTVVELDD
jgi:putative MATE family efflux protein